MPGGDTPRGSRCRTWMRSGRGCARRRTSGNARRRSGERRGERHGRRERGRDGLRRPRLIDRRLRRGWRPPHRRIERRDSPRCSRPHGGRLRISHRWRVKHHLAVVAERLPSALYGRLRRLRRLWIDQAQRLPRGSRRRVRWLSRRRWWDGQPRRSGRVIEVVLHASLPFHPHALFDAGTIGSVALRAIRRYRGRTVVARAAEAARALSATQKIGR